jgi:hypothetical protein
VHGLPCEACLADAARADQRQEAALRIRQQLANLPQLDAASHESLLGRDPGRRGWGRRYRGTQPVVQRAQFAAGRDAQLVGQLVRERAIGVTRARGLAIAGEPGHVGAQCRFVQRIDLEQPRRQRDRLGRCRIARQPRERRFAPHDAQPLALDLQPVGPRLVVVVFEAAQQLVAARGQYCRRALLLQRPLHVEHVDGRLDLQHAADRFHRMGPRQRLHAEQRLAQVGEGLPGRLSRPQERGQVGATDPGSPQRQVHEQLGAPLERQGHALAAKLDRRRAHDKQSQGHGDEPRGCASASESAQWRLRNRPQLRSAGRNGDLGA